MASENTDPQEPQSDPGGPELAPTPLDHPLFLPVLFAGVAVWFGYDAYFTTDPDMLEHLDFNRYGFRVLAFVTVLYGYRGWCEITQRREHPLVLPALLFAMTLWLAYDGWLSTDPFNVERAAISQAITPWLAVATAWYAAVGSLRLKGRPEPRFGLPLLLLFPGLWFGYLGFLEPQPASPADDLINKGLGIGLVALALWTFISRLRGAPRRAH